HESLAGRQAFSGASTAQKLAAIVETTPEPVSRFNRAVPAAFRSVIARCLEKDPGNRYRDTRDLERDLRRIRSDVNRGLTRRQWLAIGVGAAGAVTGLATWALWPRPTLAVLPFTNVAHDDSVDYLCLGL